jgi:hypothetical protein
MSMPHNEDWMPHGAKQFNGFSDTYCTQVELHADELGVSSADHKFKTV